MNVRASTTKRSPTDKVVRRKNRSGKGPGRVFIINKLKPRHKQRQG